MLVAGPGLAVGTADDRLTANIDLAPTIAALAGVAMPNGDPGLERGKRRPPDVQRPQNRPLPLRGIRYRRT